MGKYLSVCIDTRVYTRSFRRVTDNDGRCMQLYPEAGPGQKREDLIKLQAGKLYKVIFKTKDYFESTGRKCFYPWVEVVTLSFCPVVLGLIVLM